MARRFSFRLRHIKWSTEKESFAGITQSVAMLLHGWRFLRQDQLVALLDLKQDAGGDPGLVTADIVRRFSNPLSASPTESIYALGKRGAALAASAMGVDRAQLRRSSQRTSGKPLFHMLHINDVGLAFHLSASHQLGHRLDVWLDDRHLADCFSGVARLIGLALVERLHIGVEAGHDMDDGKALVRPICGLFLKALRPGQALC